MTPNPTDRDGLVLHARLDALATAVDQHGLNGKRFREHVSATIRQAAAALREDARDAVDATRYRWLRDNCFINQHDERDQPHAVIMVQWFDGTHICRMHPGHTASVGVPTLDTAIDAAMQTPSGDGGGG